MEMDLKSLYREYYSESDIPWAAYERIMLFYSKFYQSNMFKDIPVGKFRPKDHVYLISAAIYLSDSHENAEDLFQDTQYILDKITKYDTRSPEEKGAIDEKLKKIDTIDDYIKMAWELSTEYAPDLKKNSTKDEKLAFFLENWKSDY